MSISNCKHCGKLYDQDFDVEHEEDCARKPDVNYAEHNDFQDYADSEICPNCEGKLNRIWDRVSDDPILDECVEVKCTECEWSDKK